MTPATSIDATIAAVESAAVALGQARAEELRLADERPIQKLEACRRLMAAGPNELTGKPHSATSAEAIVETDPAFSAHCAARREAVLQVEVARGRFEAARLRAQLALEALEAAR